MARVRIFIPAAMIAVALSILLGASTVPAAATEVGTSLISGTVRYPTDIEAGYATVTAVSVAPDNSRTNIGEAVVNRSTGAFVLSGLPAGNYLLRLEAYSTNILDTWLGGLEVSQAQVIPLAAGEVFNGADFTPVKGASISGLATYADGFNLDGTRKIYAYAYSVAGAEVQGPLRAKATDQYSGRYTLDKLPAGEYKVEFYGSGSPDVLTEWWDNVLEPEFAETISLGPGESRIGIDTVLSDELHSFVAPTPVIQGDPRVDEALSVELGTWPRWTDLDVTWYADSTVIGYGKRLWVGASMIGKRITVEVRASKANYHPATVQSTATAPVTGKTIQPGTPMIDGEPMVGSNISFTPGVWPDGVDLTFR